MIEALTDRNLPDLKNLTMLQHALIFERFLSVCVLLVFLLVERLFTFYNLLLFSYLPCQKGLVCKVLLRSLQSPHSYQTPEIFHKDEYKIDIKIQVMNVLYTVWRMVFSLNICTLTV